MRSRALWLYRLYGLLAVAGVLTAVAALAVAFRATELSPPSVASLLASCASWLLVSAHPAAVFVLALETLSVAVIYRAMRSGWRAYHFGRPLRRELRRAGELSGRPGVHLVDDPKPQAFCAGLLRPRVYVSTGALERLDEAELRAVLAHEAHHAARRDPLRLLVAHVLSDALFFLPVVRRLRGRYAAVAELAADEAAVGEHGLSKPLASAMLTFGQLDHALVVGLSAERIDHLCGERPRWGLPASLLLAAMITLGALGALIVATADATQRSHLNAASLLMESCGPVMLFAVGFVAIRAVRLTSQRR